MAVAYRVDPYKNYNDNAVGMAVGSAWLVLLGDGEPGETAD